MKRAWLAALVTVVVVVLAVLAGTAIVREREYQALIFRGNAALAAGQTYQAIEAFSGAIALRDDAMIAYLKRGEAYRQRDENGAALRDLRMASRLDPRALRPAELIGDVNSDLERYARAAESYQAFVQIDDRSPRVFYKLGLARYRAGDVPAAVEPLQRAIALDEKFPEARYLLGLCLKDRGNTRGAVAEFEAARALAPAMVPVREELAVAYAGLGRNRNAIEQLEAIAALEPSRPERQTAVALAYAAVGQTDAAVNALGRAAERYPDNTAVFLALGRLWIDVATPRRDRVALRKAIEALQPLARRPGASSETLALLGRALALSGESARAESVLRQAALTLPIWTDALLWHADVAERLGRLKAARDSLERWTVLAAAATPGRAAVLERLGGMAIRMGDTPAAIRALEQATQATPPAVSALVALARAQELLGRLADAKATVERGVSLYPRDTSLLVLQRRIQ